MVTRIERPRSRLCVLILGICFLGIFVILLGIGDGAPSVLLVKVSEDSTAGGLTYRQHESLNIYAIDFEMSRENQLFWMDVRLSTGVDGLLDGYLPRAIEVDMTVKIHSKPVSIDAPSLNHVGAFDVNATQFCGEGEDWCDYFFLFRRDFADHEFYTIVIMIPDPEDYLSAHGNSTHGPPLFDMDSRVTSINPDFTRFEIAWKYFWLCTTLLVMFFPCGIGFRSALKRRRRDTGQGRTFHQGWTSVLLWGLVWFDDPFVAATVYTDWAKVFSAVFILSASVFIFLILLFWLCFLGDLRLVQNGHSGIHRGVCYWVPKVLLSGAIAITVLGGYMYYRFENTISFEYTGVADEKKAAEDLAGVLGFLLAVYMLWVLLMALRSCGGLRQTSPTFVLLFFVTLLACLVAIIGVFVAAYYPYSTSGVAFVGIHGLLNLYVWTLAVSFTPVRSPGAQGLGMGSKPEPIGPPPVVVSGTRTHDEHDLDAWGNPADSDFKAVEL